MTRKRYSQQFKDEAGRPGLRPLRRRSARRDGMLP